MVLSLSGAWFRFAKEYVLKGADLEVREGELAVLVGPMGSGKSTLLYAASGLLELERGELSIDGEPFEERHRREVGLVFQNPEDQLFNPTVRDEIAYALRTMGKEDEGRVLEAAREVGIEGLLDKNPFKLSYGQKKLVALASVLVYSPKYLLLDEPTANLDKKSYARVLEIVTRRKGAVVATHEVDWILVADVVYVMKGGKTIKITPEEAIKKLDSLPVAVPPGWRILMKRLSPSDLLEEARELLRGVSSEAYEGPRQASVKAGRGP